MKIANRSPLDVQLFRNAEGNDRVSAFVLAALTCDVGRAGLVASPEPMPLETDPNLSHPHDAMMPRERAASVCATGFVYAAGGKATEALARITVGSRKHEVVAIGPRVWRKSILGASPTSPLPFDRVPMDWSRAFGGKVERAWSTQQIDGDKMIVPATTSSFPANPEGMGFYLDGEHAIEHALPMLEDPEHRIEKVADWPEPRCFAPYPLWGGLRAQLIMKEDGTTIDRSALGRLTSRAAPRLTFDALPAGTPVRIDGMRPDGGSIAFEIPDAPIAVLAEIGPDRAEVRPILDSIHVDAERSRVRFVFRAPFAYDLVRRERREVTIESTESLLRLLPPVRRAG